MITMMRCLGLDIQQEGGEANPSQLVNGFDFQNGGHRETSQQGQHTVATGVGISQQQQQSQSIDHIISTSPSHGGYPAGTFQNGNGGVDLQYSSSPSNSYNQRIQYGVAPPGQAGGNSQGGLTSNPSSSSNLYASSVDSRGGGTNPQYACYLSEHSSASDHDDDYEMQYNTVNGRPGVGGTGGSGSVSNGIGGGVDRNGDGGGGYPTTGGYSTAMDTPNGRVALGNYFKQETD